MGQDVSIMLEALAPMLIEDASHAAPVNLGVFRFRYVTGW
jgi:hypothetical protein